MSLSHSPKIVTDNLLLNLDFKNPKLFTNSMGANNLVQDWKYNASTWSNIFPANTTLTTGIDAPDGTKTAVRITCKTTGSSLLRVTFNSFTPNGTDTYIASFWVRKISGSTSTGSQLNTDVQDGTPTTNYQPSLVTDKWVNITFSSVPTATAKTFIDLLSDNTNDYVLDFWGVRIEKLVDTTASIPLKDTFGNNVFDTYRQLYYTLTPDYIQFTRAASPKTGGFAFKTMTGNLTAANFLYNNHTWEVWFMIDDITPDGSTNEGYSTLAIYRGYHAGFLYTASVMQYLIWNGISGSPACAQWTIGTTGAQINQGQWYQIVVVNLNGTFVPYINGSPLGTGYTPTISASGIGTTNVVTIGASQNVTAGTGNYCYYSKNKIANMKMYNRALSESEIKQNFNALRGRFGI